MMVTILLTGRSSRSCVTSVFFNDRLDWSWCEFRLGNEGNVRDNNRNVCLICLKRVKESERKKTKWMCYKLIRLGFCGYRFGIGLKREKDVLKRENDDMQMLLYVKKELVGDLRQIYFFKWKTKFGLEISLYIYNIRLKFI